MLREKPYQLLHPGRDFQRWISSVRLDQWQVLHGCRQLVSWDVRLSPLTSATPILICHQVMLGTIGKLPTTSWRKVGMMSSHHGPYGLGYTHATMVITTGMQYSNVELILQRSSQFGLRAATRPHEVGIASNRGSARRGEYVLGSCTHCPSSHGSCFYPNTVS